MRTKRGTRLAVAGLTGAAALLALVDLHLLRSPVDTSPIAPPAPRSDATRPESPAPTTPLDKKAAEQFLQTVSRPLFNPSRRPVQRNEAAPRQPKVEPARLRLVGVMKVGGEPPRALIRFADEPTGRWIAEGGEIKGWTLVKIKDGSVIVEAGGRTQELKLFIPPPPPKEPVVPRPAPKAPARPKADSEAGPQADANPEPAR